MKTYFFMANNVIRNLDLKYIYNLMPRALTDRFIQRNIHYKLVRECGDVTRTRTFELRMDNEVYIYFFENYWPSEEESCEFLKSDHIIGSGIYECCTNPDPEGLFNSLNVQVVFGDPQIGQNPLLTEKKFTKPLFRVVDPRFFWISKKIERLNMKLRVWEKTKKRYTARDVSYMKMITPE